MSELELLISKDKLTVHINVMRDSIPLQIEESDVYSLLSKHGISFGIKRDVISKMVSDVNSMLFPVLLAEGEASQKGEDGFIKLETVEQKHEIHSNEVLNFRNVRQIPSVRAGQLVATIYPSKLGIPGRNVFGHPIAAADGNPNPSMVGKNVVETNGKLYASIDGQITLSDKKINVLPFFEVDGDLNLKTGNIDFVGNVTIRGNVPSDYVVKAGGDISIYGIVEGAQIVAGGSIFIYGGIVGFTKALIRAEGDIIASYLNQCQVYAGKNIEITGSILHSVCFAKENVHAITGSLIGGLISAGNHVTAKDIGNASHTKTEIQIGTTEHNSEEEKRIRSEIDTTKAHLQKVLLILQKLAEKYKRTSILTEDEVLLLKRDKLTQTELTKKLELLESELLELSSKQKEVTAFIIATGNLYPNVNIQFGKYKRITNQLFHHVKAQLVNKEISIDIYSEK
ncbi:DUF342 domain-containing protein [Bacillus timonensis]|uniref:DUF342 domain-containing protein n=1 Tax=Bacillus timonensis TaxID=1033734 RepID=A0A4S3PXY8_9BACI|nr:FapA family protein [Bacillus timonensis]THE14494.1 DUF342 domain-containing protein [Bacillus timonensis]